MSIPMMSKAPKGYRGVSTLNPQQGQLLQQLLSQLLGSPEKPGLSGQAGQYWQDILSGSPESFERFQAPYLRAFQEETIPQLAERFGGIGAQSSSAFQQALGKAGTGLQEQLASLKEGMRYQTAGNIMDQIQNLLNLQTQAYLPKSQSFLKSLLGGLAGGIGSGIGRLF